MTTTQELVAGRELDALVAEKVMGWKQWGLDTRLGRLPLLQHPATGEINPPSYSTDIAAAWQVVEHLRVEDMGINVYAYQAGFAAHVGLLNDTWADTAPLAICRAALAAVG